MFNIFHKKPQGEKATFSIDGMHCSSCSMNIDGELEDIDGVIEAKTSYAKATTQVVYDPQKINPIKIKEAIERVGYAAKEM